MCARCLAAQAALVIVASRKQTSVDASVSKLLSAAGIDPKSVVKGFTCNVSSAKDVETLFRNVDETLKARGMAGLNALVSNVGVDPVSGPALKQVHSISLSIYISSLLRC